MQTDFDNYGIENFLFEPLLLFGRRASKEELERLETEISLTLPADKRYNVYVNWRKRGSEVNPFYGKQHTIEARKAQSQSKLGQASNFSGKIQTEEVKKFLSQQNSGTSNKERRKPLYINNIYYESVSPAEEETKLSRRLIRERCNSKDFRWENYRWATPDT